MTERINMAIFAPICYDGRCEAVYFACDICGAMDEPNAAYYERDDFCLVACQACIRAGQTHVDWRLRKQIAKRNREHTPPYPEFHADTEILRSLIGRISIPSWNEWKASPAYPHAMAAE